MKEQNNCYYFGEKDSFCHMEYVEKVDGDCNLCKNIDACLVKQVRNLSLQLAIKSKTVEVLHKELCKRQDILSRPHGEQEMRADLKYYEELAQSQLILKEQL